MAKIYIRQPGTHVDRGSLRQPPVLSPEDVSFDAVLTGPPEVGDSVDHETAQARKLAKEMQPLVEQGVTVPQAAQRVGINWRALNDTTRLVVKELIAGNYLPPEIIREAVRAGRFKLFLEGVNAEGDDKAAHNRRKLALEASKQIGMDPQIGLNQQPIITLDINMRPVQELAEKLEIPEGYDLPDEKTD